MLKRREPMRDGVPQHREHRHIVERHRVDESSDIEATPFKREVGTCVSKQRCIDRRRPQLLQDTGDTPAAIDELVLGVA